ncbi:MAG: hypothetical protein KJT03_23830, partial [Verrucomicrobiae bacterium]|nr:hypothetical protein [Verrucomicrobiae bacterium]
MGKWKYIRMYDGKEPYSEADVDFANRKPEFEMLFDLEADPGERNNLIAQMSGTSILETLRHKTAAYSESLNARRQAFKKEVAVQGR